MTSSSPSCLTFQRKYDVFLSFRGEDTRYNFTSHLFAALNRKKITTFMDEELIRGDEISSAILNTIEGSKISVLIFSKDYASSKWCLDELVKILECQKMSGQKVIPVFYHVDPSDVRKQTGSFGDASVKHDNQFKDMLEKVKKWRAALTEASNLSGWDSMKIRPEAKLVDEIVSDILKKLDDVSISSDFEGLIGIERRIERIKSLLCIGLSEFRIVGIWGMGGIGKTNIVGAVFNQISNEFEGKCFIANVREESEKGGGLIHLRQQILSQILQQDLNIGTPGIPQYTKERLQRMKIFLVLDDVNKFGQLEYLAGGTNQFGPGSRIIVTTRDKKVLDKYGVEHIYEVEELNYNEALELFCNYAFRDNYRPEDLLVLSKRVLDYAKGNPLALKVLGSSFNRKSKKDWKNLLHNLKQLSDPEIDDVLKISYNELNWEEKSIFLDVACFFKGEDKDYVTMILEGCYSAYYGLSVLIDKSLVTISNNKLQMHDLLQEMGREIVRQESNKEVGKRSRLWYHKDIYDVLKKNKGTDSIEGIFLDMSKIKGLDLNPKAFANMSNLRLLKFYVPKLSGDSDMISKVHLCQGLEYLSDELRYLHWHRYPLKMLPSSFSPENLVELNMPYSKIEKLWDGSKEGVKLKSIDLHHSQYLTRIPDPSETPNLERINLLNCTNLLSIPPSIQCFNNLTNLCLERCESLRSFPNYIHFRSLLTLNLSHCINLRQFPQISGKIKMLYLGGTAVEEVPSSIECLTELFLLDLKGCMRLKSLSTSICKLKTLCWLLLDDCSRLKSFPAITETMEHLRHLSLDSTALKELPSSIEHLKGLTTLSLTDCHKLVKLPDSLGGLKSLRSLSTEGSAISHLPSSIADMKKLKYIRCSGCRDLVLPSLSGLSSITELDLSDSEITEIPQDIGCAFSLRSLDLRGNNFKSLPASIKQLSRLRFLILSNCHMLQSLPELPSGLQQLQATNCKQLQSLPELPSCLEELDASKLETISELANGFSGPAIEFMFTNCLKLNKKECNILADSQFRIHHMATATLRLFLEKKFHTPHGISICLPGRRIPDWFCYQNSGSLITIQLPQDGSNRRLIGFALCAVIAFGEEFNAGRSFGVSCKYHFGNKTLSQTKYLDKVSYLMAARGYDFFIDLDHILLGFDPCLSVRLPNGDHNVTASFEFSVYDTYPNQKVGYWVKCCGVCPLYALLNKTQSNSLTEKYGGTAEEVCVRIRKFPDEYDCNDETSTSEVSYGQELEPNPKRTCREQVNTP